MTTTLTPFLKPIEFALNKALAADPDTQAKLSAFDEHQITIHITDLNLMVHLLFHQHVLRLSTGDNDDADLTLAGKSSALARLGRHPEALFSEDITIYGNVQFAKQLQDILDSFEFDWEQHLVRLTGDTLAFPIAHGIRQLGQWLSNSHHSMQLNISEYLKEESQLLPDRSQVRHHLSQIDVLRADLDRLEARINRILKS